MAPVPRLRSARPPASDPRLPAGAGGADAWADARASRAMTLCGLAFVGLFGAVVWKLHALQYVHYGENLSAVERGMAGVETRPGRRGTIVDAVGRTLAVSVGARSCAIDPEVIRRDENARLDDVLDALDAVLGLTPGERDRIRQAADRNAAAARARAAGGEDAGARAVRFAWVRRKLPDADADALERAMRKVRAEAARLRGEARDKAKRAHALLDRDEAARLLAEAEGMRREARRVGAWYAGVIVEREYARQYPQGRVAAHMVGFVDAYDRGLEGIEKFGDAYLTGVAVRRPVRRDAANRPLADAAREWPEEWTGLTLELSVDSVIQLIAQEELAKGVASAGDSPDLGGVAIVMDPRTGDVLAAASWPDFDPNDASRAPARARRNDAVASTMEPGSIMKPFVYARAYEKGLLRFDEIIDCTSPYTMAVGRARRAVKDLKGLNYGPLTAEMALVKSSNPGAVKVGERLGVRGLYELVHDMGLGERTTTVRAPGRPATTVLAGELPGKVYPFAQWNGYALGSVPQGYEFTATPLQMAAAYCAFANGGWLPAPRVVRAVRRSDGRLVEQVPARHRRRVFTEGTADAMRERLRKVVTHGTGRKANIPEYAIAGKSGTANLPANAEEKAAARARGEKIGYSDTRHVSNFAAMAPVEDPRIVVLVSIRETTKYGGEASGPVCRDIIRRTLEYLHFPPATEPRPAR